MSLVDVISKETEAEIVATMRQLAKTAAAAERLLTNLDADRAFLRRMMAAMAESAEAYAQTAGHDDGAGGGSLPDRS